MKLRLVCVALAWVLSGCASAQLNYNTLEISSTVDHLVTSQVLYNIAKYVENPWAVPAQVNIPAGSVQTTNQLSASYTDPVNKALTAINTVATAAAKTVTNTNQVVTAATTVTPSANDQWSQNWSLSPVIDGDQVRRLRALYRYVTRPEEVDLCAEYPRILTQLTGISYTRDGDDQTIVADDTLFLNEPSCIICREGPTNAPTLRKKGSRPPAAYHRNICVRNAKASKGEDYYINGRLTNHWLRWRSPSGRTSYPSPCDQDIFLGTYLGYSLYTTEWKGFQEFVVFILEATSQGSTVGQSGKTPAKGSGGAFPQAFPVPQL
jgi:hypothetical protein